MLLLLGTSVKTYAASLPGATAAYACQPRGRRVEPFSVLKVSSHTRAALGTYCACLQWQQLGCSAAAQAVSSERNPSLLR